jgi:transposase
VTAALETRPPDDRRPVLIMAQDEGRFGRISGTKRAWAPPTVRPVAPRQIVREYLYAFVAVCPALGRMTSLVMPYANTAMMSLFLAHLSRDFNEHFVLMLMDQAGWHVSRNLQVPENIRLIPLPPYSPELNPVEHVWDDIRERGFHNKAFPSLDEVEDQLCNQLMALQNEPKRLRSLTSFPYMNITC